MREEIGIYEFITNDFGLITDQGNLTNHLADVWDEKILDSQGKNADLELVNCNCSECKKFFVFDF